LAYLPLRWVELRFVGRGEGVGEGRGSGMLCYEALYYEFI
jgi:hypothetical protein